MEKETFEISASFEETQKRIEDDNKATEQSERQAAREREKSQRAEAAMRSVSFQGQDDSPHNTTFNAGAGDTPPRTVPTPRSVLKRKDCGSVGGAQGSSNRTQKILKISEVYPASDWPLGMTQDQV